MAEAVSVQGDRRAERHAATRQQILDAAWRLAHERGLGSWSLRDLAEAVGMRAPSLYGYFASKNAVFDAMFAQGYRELLAAADALEADRSGAGPVELLRASGPMFVDFCVAAPVSAPRSNTDNPVPASATSPGWPGRRQNSSRAATARRRVTPRCCSRSRNLSSLRAREP